MIGVRFGRLVVIAIDRQEKCGKYVVCECDCGSSKVVFLGSLRQGRTKSCGCLNSEAASKRKTRHGLTKTRTHNIWLAIKARCFNPNSEAYPHYGGRGITMCPEWAESFDSFLADMGQCPKGLSIERTNNNDDYRKDNCKWASSKDQANNRRSNILLTYNDETCTIQEWAEKTGLPYFTLRSRIQILGWSHERALTQPSKRKAQ